MWPMLGRAGAWILKQTIGKHWGKIAIAGVADDLTTGGKGREWVGDKAVDILKATGLGLWDLITNPIDTYNKAANFFSGARDTGAALVDGYSDLRDTTQGAVSALRDPAGAVDKALGGGGMLSGLFNFFKNPEGGMNWGRTILAGLAAFFGIKMLTGGNSQGGSMATKLLMTGLLVGGGLLLYNNLKNNGAEASQTASAAPTTHSLGDAQFLSTQQTASLGTETNIKLGSEFGNKVAVVAESPTPARSDTALGNQFHKGLVTSEPVEEDEEPRVQTADADLDAAEELHHDSV